LAFAYRLEYEDGRPADPPICEMVGRRRLHPKKVIDLAHGAE
jgi:hypothetical protein